VSGDVDTQALGRKLVGATATLTGVVAAEALGLALLSRGRTGAGLAVIATPLALPLARRAVRRVRA
jgi:hypothetical protein